MDGLTVSTAKDLLNTGKTDSERIKKRLVPQSEGPNNSTFKNTLSEAIDKVNQLQNEADVKMQKIASGESTNISEVIRPRS